MWWSPGCASEGGTAEVGKVQGEGSLTGSMESSMWTTWWHDGGAWEGFTHGVDGVVDVDDLVVVEGAEEVEDAVHRGDVREEGVPQPRPWSSWG